ncbi:hypothetical protein KPH14_005461 [Odynerus spinipes]|uniref:Guanylate cyclase domain-containing protein n=1 Tax=Odynerus spinipes TaxID=1348599 RepID=A0AAD9VK96_9HYME|nr:hypothetical protein KPH14_005461 [Odynerus spinipes]
MCPDEILDNYGDYTTRKYYTTLMLGDVSGIAKNTSHIFLAIQAFRIPIGFTDLAEKYTRTGRGGPSKLTDTLNSYIGAMVQEILSHNGDVLKFSGDAFIVMWKLEENANMRDLVTVAIQTACIIQKHFGVYETDIGVVLRVKLAIASGKTYFTSIGDPNTMSHYIITGRPVWEVKHAERLCKGGDILVALSSWQWANPIEYVYETLPDGLHTLIIACSSMWYTLKGTYITNDDRDDQESEDTSSAEEAISTAPSEGMLTGTSMGMIDLSGPILYQDNTKEIDYTLRPKIVKVAKARLKDSLRSYMLRPVIRSVEMDEPLEYLTEMRQVVIVFVNAVTSELHKRKLVALVDIAYKLVCRIVDGMQGCVNKTSLFDKDLTFLCIFGLRGDKHELESQIGLKCAFRVRESVKELKDIANVTVGVTTGVTYCGVVGHILRREYTVIGMAVNKAARLMCVYQNKVVCDRESFLHSRLEGSHFKLQEPKYLKGISDVGPVYEFEEQVKYKVSELVWSKYPLLGRDEEMKIFGHLLATLVEYVHLEKNGISKPQYNTLLIKGEPRIGKTRLLDEMSLNIPTEQTPYILMHLIFSLPLGFTVTSTSKDREAKLTRLLNNVRYPEYLCALNQPFNVRFPMTTQYRVLIDLEKQKILQHFLRRLTEKCFQQLWVIVIDDMEYADEESLNFIDTLTKTDTIFFVISVGRKVSAEYRIAHTLLERAYIIELQGIDKWYHVGIVCQVLNVVGISPELERLIQEKSLGNPGWIESYLISLMQSGTLAIIIVTRKEADIMGYVLPDENMLKRPTSDTVLSENERPRRDDRWQMYEASYTNTASIESDTLQRSNPDFENEEEINVAFSRIREESSSEETNVEMTMDVMILKLFDALTPLDQFLLKCASVLGVSVNRKMLESITEMSTRNTAHEIFVTTLATLGFPVDVLALRYQVFFILKFNVTIFPLLESDYCLAELENMPKYASCGLMRFKMTLFRDTTYGLLTETQKMELHNKALKFLQTNARRCVACGEGPFSILLGEKIGNELGKRQMLLRQELNMTQLLAPSIFEEPQLRIKNVLSSKRSSNFLNIFKKPETKLTRTFSNIDFTNCQCNLILITVYTQMVEHCRGIGKDKTTLAAILEFTEICIENQNIPQARKLLSEAETILQRMFDPDKDEMITYLYLTAKIQSLQARCYFECGHISEAERSLNRAMKTLGYKFPRLDILTGIKTMFQLKKLKLLLICPWKRKSEIENVDHVSEYTNQLAYCLALMFDVYRAKGMKSRARLAAIWALNTARPNNDFVTLLICYTNMLITAHIYGEKNIIPSLENESIELCNEEKRSIEYRDLKVIVELYAGVFFSRWIRGNIAKAIEIGFIANKLAKTIDLTYIECIVLPRLIQLLMISSNHSQVVSALRELEFVSKNTLDKSGRTWYYAICADVQLDTGLMILSFQHCERYYLEEGESMISLQDPEAERRYFTSMWLWCIRNKEWEASRVWLKKQEKRITTDEDIVVATFTALKKIEGLLICYVYYENKYDPKAIAIISDVKAGLKLVKKKLSIVKIATPRYILLRAYYFMTRGHTRTAIRILQEAKKVSLKMDNKMIYKWATHCKQAWTGKMSSIQQNKWLERSMINSVSPWDEINANDADMIPYTLPIPHYMN